MKSFLYSWMVSLLLILLLDLVWFSITVERFYKPNMTHILTGEFSYLTAAIFYILYSFGLAYLIIVPALNSEIDIIKVACNGLILGLISYGAYDLTNQATIKDWPIIVTVVDMTWGASLTCIASSIAYKTVSFILK